MEHPAESGGTVGPERRAAEYFEAWKKVAERDVHVIFATLPVHGPAIPD